MLLPTSTCVCLTSTDSVSSNVGQVKAVGKITYIPRYDVLQVAVIHLILFPVRMNIRKIFQRAQCGIVILLCIQPPDLLLMYMDSHITIQTFHQHWAYIPSHVIDTGDHSPVGRHSDLLFPGVSIVCVWRHWYSAVLPMFTPLTFRVVFSTWIGSSHVISMDVKANINSKIDSLGYHNSVINTLFYLT